MQRKQGFPVANCNIKMPDGMPAVDTMLLEDDGEPMQRRQQLINFGHAQWGFNNWSWSVSKQELDFVEFANGKFCAGVCAYVSISVKSFDIHRENIGYATSLASNKGSAIYKSRKCAVTNALRETLLSFGGSVATELMELLEAHKNEFPAPPAPVTAPSAPALAPAPAPAAAPPDPQPENNQNLPNKPAEPKNSPLNMKPNMRKDSADSGGSANNVLRSPHPCAPSIKSAAVGNPPPPVAKAHPMPANVRAALPAPAPAPAPRPPPPPPTQHHPRPNSNEARPLESMSEEEARAERKRRQQRAQEEFRLRMLKHNQGNDAKPQPQADMSKAASSFDALLMDIPTQDIEIEQTAEDGKRKSPGHDTSAKRRASVMNRLDIVTD